MNIKKKAYALLIERKASIKKAYLKYNTEARSPVKKAFYILRLNFAYYILRDRSLSKYNGGSGRPYSKGPESALSLRETPEKLAKMLSEYDAVSFDIFDTLIFRPFSKPSDLFHIAGAEAGLLNFAQTREYCERKAREKKFKSEKTYEIDIDDIYEYMGEYAGTSYLQAKEKELEAEAELCYANPYLKRVWQLLRETGVKIYVISDMYLKREFLEEILRKNGFEGYERLIVSNECKSSKFDGKLYEIAKTYMGEGKHAHVGDNEKSDVINGRAHGFFPFGVKNINLSGGSFRPDGMSRITGSAYVGIVNGKFHCGLYGLSLPYEYGYAYGGIFVLGYCNYIRKIQISLGADKILFLARDGELLKKIYDKLYPQADTEYFLWSRLAAGKLCFEENTLDFMRRFVYHKSNGNLKAEEILEQADLSQLIPQCPLKNTLVNKKNYKMLSEYILINKDGIIRAYENQRKGAEIYFNKKLSGSRRVLAADAGWAGSGAAAIGTLAKKWVPGTEVIGVIAGTNDSFNEQPDASEALMQSGRLYSFCFSQRHNRDIYLTHNSASGHNIFFEALLGSEQPSLKGFDKSGEPVFCENERNGVNVSEIHRGAEDFCDDYIKAFKKYPYMLDISGSDAYGPFLSAIRDKNRYFGTVFGGYSFNTGVGTGESPIRSQIH